MSIASVNGFGTVIYTHQIDLLLGKQISSLIHSKVRIIAKATCVNLIRHSVNKETRKREKNMTTIERTTDKLKSEFYYKEFSGDNIMDNDFHYQGHILVYLRKLPLQKNLHSIQTIRPLFLPTKLEEDNDVR